MKPLHLQWPAALVLMLQLLTGVLLIQSASGIKLARSLQAKKGHSCYHLGAGETAIVVGGEQNYGSSTYLVARNASSEAPIGQAGLYATLEALLDQCAPVLGTIASGSSWFVTTGSGDDSEMAALASSLGCGVAAITPKAEHIQQLELTRCVNDPETPFIVLQDMVTDTTREVELWEPGNSTVFDDFAATSAGKGSHGQALAQGNSRYSDIIISEGNISRSNASHNGTGKEIVPGISLDSLFMEHGKGMKQRHSGAAEGASWDTDIAMLKVTPKGCCGSNATVQALQGAKDLLKSGRVRCLVAEVNFAPETTAALITELHDLEYMGYQLFQLGPLDAPQVTESEIGSYPLFSTDSHQLQDLFTKLLSIRRFDEKSGQRAYSGGMNLDRHGHFFDYTELVIAYLGKLPAHLNVVEHSKARFNNGMWWPEQINATNASL